MRAREWQRLALRIRRRRVDLDVSQQALADAANVSLRTIANLEAGQPAKERTLARIERALRWIPGSVDTILDGGEPSELQAENLDEVVDESVDAAEAAIINASNTELVRLFRIVEAGRGITSSDADQWLVDALDMRDRARQRKEAAKRSAS